MSCQEYDVAIVRGHARQNDSAVPKHGEQKHQRGRGRAGRRPVFAVHHDCGKQKRSTDEKHDGNCEDRRRPMDTAVKAHRHFALGRQPDRDLFRDRGVTTDLPRLRVNPIAR